MAAVPVGFFAGLFGIGGGLISVPFLFFIFDFLNLTEDYTMHLAVGTAFFITIFTSTASVLTHRKHNAVDFSVLKIFGLFVILGVFFLKERLSKTEVLGIFLTIIGGSLITFNNTRIELIGSFYAISAAFFYSILFIIVKKTASDFMLDI